MRSLRYANFAANPFNLCVSKQPKGRASKPQGVAESHMQTGKCTHTRTCSLPLLQCQILVGGRLLSLIDLMDFGAQGLSSQTKQSDSIRLLEFLRSLCPHWFGCFFQTSNISHNDLDSRLASQPKLTTGGSASACACLRVSLNTVYCADQLRSMCVCSVNRIFWAPL